MMRDAAQWNCTRSLPAPETNANISMILPEFDIHELRSQLFHWCLNHGVERTNLQGVS